MYVIILLIAILILARFVRTKLFGRTFVKKEGATRITYHTNSIFEQRQPNVLKKATQLKQDKKLDEAIEILEKEHKRDKKSLRVSEKLASYLSSQKRYTEAIAVMEDSVQNFESDPELVEYWDRLSNLYSKTGNARDSAIFSILSWHGRRVQQVAFHIRENPAGRKQMKEHHNMWMKRCADGFSSAVCLLEAGNPSNSESNAKKMVEKLTAAYADINNPMSHQKIDALLRKYGY